MLRAKHRLSAILATFLLAPISLFLTASQAAYAELPPLIPRDVLFGNPEKIAPDLSPDGKMIEYLAPDDKGVLNVWVKTVGQNDDRLITADKKRGIRHAFWQEDGKHIIYLQDLDGDENWHVYQTNIVSKLTRDLTPFQGARAEDVMVDQNFPNEILVSLNIRDPKLFDVYRVNLYDGALDRDSKNPGDISQWIKDNNFQIRGAIAMEPDGRQELRVRANKDSIWRTLASWGPEETEAMSMGFTPDNKSILLITSVGANTARLVSIDLDTGKETVVASDAQFDVSGGLRNPKTHALEAVAFEKQRLDWQVVDADFKADFTAIKSVADGDIGIDSQDNDGQKWIVSIDQDNRPVSYYLYDRISKQATFLFCSRPKLADAKLAKMQPITIVARDGMKLYGYLTLPPGVAAKDLPMVLLVHGGPWSRDSWGYYSTVQWLANRGYAVLEVNYRGSSGFGKQYLHAGDKQWAGTMRTDLLDAKNWAVKQGYADAHKISIFGGSYGGYATLAGVAFSPSAFVCGVDICGPSNLVTLLKTIPPYWEVEKALFTTRLGDADKDADFLKAQSPLFKADQIKVPMLIGQGANDPRVKKAESDQMVDAIRKNGKTVDYIVFPDEGHGFVRPENKLVFFALTEDFLAKQLGGRAEPPSKKEKWDSYLQ